LVPVSAYVVCDQKVRHISIKVIEEALK